MLWNVALRNVNHVNLLATDCNFPQRARGTTADLRALETCAYLREKCLGYMRQVPSWDHLRQQLLLTWEHLRHELTWDHLGQLLTWEHLRQVFTWDNLRQRLTWDNCLPESTWEEAGDEQTRYSRCEIKYIHDKSWYQLSTKTDQWNVTLWS